MDFYKDGQGLQTSSHGCYSVSVRLLKGFLKGCHMDFYKDSNGTQNDSKGFLHGF